MFAARRHWRARSCECSRLHSGDHLVLLLVFLRRETLLLLLSWLSVEERARLGRSVRCWAALEGVVLGALCRRARAG